MEIGTPEREYIVIPEKEPVPDHVELPTHVEVPQEEPEYVRE